MGKVWLVVLLAVGGSASVSAKTCDYLVAMRGLEAAPEFAPLPRALVRSALDDLRKTGQVASILRLLREASWTTRGPIPPVRWRIGKFRADFFVKDDKPRLRLRLPRSLVRSPIALAVGLHEDLHARVFALLPGLSEHEVHLNVKLQRQAETPEAFVLAEELAELRYQQERLALIAESAIYTALDDRERRTLLEALAVLPRESIARADRKILRTAVASGTVPAEQYLRRQYAIDRYSRADCLQGYREDVQAFRQLAQDERDAQAASGE